MQCTLESTKSNSQLLYTFVVEGLWSACLVTCDTCLPGFALEQSISPVVYRAIALLDGSGIKLGLGLGLGPLGWRTGNQTAP